MAEDRVDPLKIISLSRDLFFSFIPGLLSCTARSPAAQAAGPRPGYRHLCKRPHIDNGARERRADGAKICNPSARGGQVQSSAVPLASKDPGPALSVELTRGPLVFMFVAASLSGLVFEPCFNKSAENRHLHVYLVRLKPPPFLF